MENDQLYVDVVSFCITVTFILPIAAKEIVFYSLRYEELINYLQLHAWAGA